MSTRFPKIRGITYIRRNDYSRGNSQDFRESWIFLSPTDIPRCNYWHGDPKNSPESWTGHFRALPIDIFRHAGYFREHVLEIAWKFREASTNDAKILDISRIRGYLRDPAKKNTVPSGLEIFGITRSSNNNIVPCVIFSGAKNLLP